jgi:hypothetical protein
LFVWIMNIKISLLSLTKSTLNRWDIDMFKKQEL